MCSAIRAATARDFASLLSAVQSQADPEQPPDDVLVQIPGDPVPIGGHLQFECAARLSARCTANAPDRRRWTPTPSRPHRKQASRECARPAVPRTRRHSTLNCLTPRRPSPGQSAPHRLIVNRQQHHELAVDVVVVQFRVDRYNGQRPIDESGDIRGVGQQRHGRRG